MRLIRIGELAVRLTGGDDGVGGGDGPLLVLCHGFGAPGDDLVGLDRMLGLPAGVRVAYPAAPLDLSRVFGPGSSAWWMIDVEAIATRSARAHDFRRGDAAGQPEARAALAAVLDALAPAGTPLVIGGFSQGAILACDLALRDPRPLAGLVLLSGTAMAADVWPPRMAARAGLPVFQSHGRHDPILPYALAEELRDQLGAAGVPVEFVGFEGGHESPPPVLRALGAFLARTLAT